MLLTLNPFGRKLSTTLYLYKENIPHAKLDLFEHTPILLMTQKLTVERKHKDVLSTEEFPKETINVSSFSLKSDLH